MSEDVLEVHIMTSNRHAHLSKESEKVLFGEAGVTLQRPLSDDTSTFACNETVTIEGPKGSISGVRVLGPCRDYDQVELLAADTFKLGVDAPIRMAGELDGAATVKIIGPKGSVEVPCGIVAYRHIHIGSDLLEKHGLAADDEVSVKIDGIRGGTMDHVRLKKAKSKPNASATMHIDQEEGNAFGIAKTATGTVIL